MRRIRIFNKPWIKYKFLKLNNRTRIERGPGKGGVYAEGMLTVLDCGLGCSAAIFWPTNTQIHLLNKLDKNVAKPLGFGSPFKCIGLGLAQQMKLEKDEDLTAARLRIEELESLAANRQKEIFSLNARLAAAQSMTHDVIRDLLRIKLGMTNYVSLLDNQQVQKIAENAGLDSLEFQVKDHEVVKLKQ